MTTRHLVTSWRLGSAALGAEHATATTARPTTVAAQTSAPTQTSPRRGDRIALRQNTTLKQANNASALNSVTLGSGACRSLPDLRFNTTTGQNYGRGFSVDEGRIIDQTTQSLNAGVSSTALFNGMSNVASLRSYSAWGAGERNVHAPSRRSRSPRRLLALVQRQGSSASKQENLDRRRHRRADQAYVNAGSRPISDLYQQQATVAAALTQVVNAQRVGIGEGGHHPGLNLDPRGNYAFTHQRWTDDGEHQLSQLRTSAAC
jgi:outer membrane protein